MLEGLFAPLHLLIMAVLALIIFGVPLLILFRLARWFDRRLQGRPGVRVNFVGVLIGGITDVGFSTLLAIPLLIYEMAKYDLFHAAVTPTAAALVQSNVWLYACVLAIGVGCSALGGYVAARIAGHDELLNGLLSSFLCIATGIYSVAAHKNPQSLLFQMSLLVSGPAFALLGGYLRQTQKRMRSAAI